jgi:hypothetical protein
VSIFNRKKRKEKRGITPVAPEKTYPAASYWETYEGGEYIETPAPSYDSSPTTYDTPTYSTPSQSYDSSSSSGSGYSGSDSSSSSSSSDSGGSW